jgi:hypothetical protein
MNHSNNVSILRLVVSLTLLAGSLLAPVSLTHAAAGINRYVSPTGSNTTNCASAAAPCRTIAYALNQAVSGDTLLLDNGVYPEHLTIAIDIRIAHNPAKTCAQTGSLNYVPCTIIDGGNAARVIDITVFTSQVSLEKITVRNGYVIDSNGAGIRNNGILTMDDVDLHHNIIHLTKPTEINDNYPYRGGGIDNLHDLTLRSSTVYNNSANDGGGITSAGGSLLVQNTEIYGNSAQRFGGGVWVPYGDPSTLENSTLHGNTAGSGGAGMYINSDGIVGHRGNPHIFRNVTISGNTGSLYGGGLVSYLQVTLDHCTLGPNSAPGTGAELDLRETQTIDGVAHSVVADTIIANPAATLSLCSITNAASFTLSGGGNLSSDHSCDFTLLSDQIDKNPRLLPLANNGGHVRTQALSYGSPAIDKAGAYALGADARGVPPLDGDLNGSVVPDVGAYEYMPFRSLLPVVRR